MSRVVDGIAVKNNERAFKMHRQTVGGQTVNMFKLTCGTPACGFEGEIINAKNSPLPSQVVDLKFRRKGWEVGKDERFDKCPRCVEKETIERRRRRNLNRPQESQSPPATETQPMLNPPPPTMTREHKRIINIKLHEVYINENEGCQTPWSDKNVAQHLGIPVSWVEEVREELFGPAQDNAEVREFLAKAKTVNENTAKILTDASAKLAEAKNVLAAIKTVEQTLGDVRRLLDTMNAAAVRIERAVAP